MVKFAVLIAAFFIFNAVAARPENVSESVRKMKQQLTAARDDTLNMIANLQLSDRLQRRALALQGNQFANRAEAGIYQIYRGVILANEDQSHRNLPLAASNLNDMVYEIRQTVIEDNPQIRQILKEMILKAAHETNRLIEAAQYYETVPDEQYIFKDVSEMIGKVVDAIRRFPDPVPTDVDRQLGNLKKKVDSACEPWVTKITDTMEKIKNFDAKTAHFLAHEGYEVSSLISHVVRIFDRESYKFSGEVKKNVDSVVSQLRQHRAELDKVLENHSFPTVKDRVKEIKRVLLVALQEGSVQISVLCELAKAVDRSDAGNEAFYQVMQKVGPDCLNSTIVMLWKLQEIGEGHPY